ncbi:hypothetical protein EBR66_07060 [bacterium]|nr:hypothetical protein [bacterium]
MAKTRRASRMRKSMNNRMMPFLREPEPMMPSPVGFMVGETIIIRRVNSKKGKKGKKGKKHTRKH